MISLRDRVRRTTGRHGLIPPGGRVAVAVSGGPDSVALLTVLCDMAVRDGFHIAGVAHLNHRLRGQDADEDEAFCRRLAAARGLPVDVERIDVAGIAAACRGSIESVAHTERHAFFDRAAGRLSADRVAVGHTRDDQAETFLLRLIRGAGPRGLGGIHPRAGLIIRPLIDATRTEIHAYLRSQGAEYRDDLTNADTRIPRNRVRHELIPFLRERFSPAVVDTLDREACIAREDAEFLDHAAAEATIRLTIGNRDRMEIALGPLLREPAAIVRRVIQNAQRAVAGGRFVGFEAVDAVFTLAVSNTTGKLQLAGHRAVKRGGRLVLTPCRGRGASGVSTTEFSYLLGIPGSVTVPEASCRISAEAADVPSETLAGRLWPFDGRNDLAVMEAAGIQAPLTVRSRKPGDVLRPLGLGGRKKLQDLFVDGKVERAVRDTIPVVVDAGGQIVWVAGHALADDFRVTDHTKAVVILRRTTLGG